EERERRLEADQEVPRGRVTAREEAHVQEVEREDRRERAELRRGGGVAQERAPLPPEELGRPRARASGLPREALGAVGIARRLPGAAVRAGKETHGPERDRDRGGEEPRLRRQPTGLPAEGERRGMRRVRERPPRGRGRHLAEPFQDPQRRE